MYLAGHESITRRNRRELCTLEDKLGQSPSQVVIRHVVFPIHDEQAALSWHLTQRQIAYIRDAINQKEAQKALNDAAVWFKGLQNRSDKLPTTETCHVYPE
jgi:hypothetical protein